jgi:uncharacterized protein (DUF1800 family)
MTIPRRRFLGGSAAAISAAVGASAAPGRPASAGPLVPQSSAALAEAPAAETPPAIEVIALNRMAYGPRPGDLERVQSIGLQAYVDEQLSPNDADDATCTARLAAARLRIQYGAGSNYPAVDEMRPLRTVVENWSQAQLWALVSNAAGAERTRPLDEVRAAAWIRAVYSKWQLREVLVEFWHNHFNVDATIDNRISATWPLYDRIMRRNCMGNFRTFLEEVAQSIAMQFYLDNAFSRDGPANENYARELFELHTLGAPHYLNALYNRWRDVPGALDVPPAPQGYIDQDVYEAARAFTGWTIAYGQTLTGSLKAANTGDFLYYDGWHDSAQKRVLAAEIDSFQPPLADGRAVLDMVANHPGTARYVCTKLCRRLVADEPPETLVDAAVAAWTTARNDADQIAKTVRAILLAPEFAAAWGGKVKQPFEVVTSFLRATNADFTPNSNLFTQVNEMGYRMFAWSPPTGHPDEAPYWLSTNVMLRRWNILLALFGQSLGASFQIGAQQPGGSLTARQIVDFWVGRLIGRPLPSATYDRLLDFMRQSQAADSPPTGNDIPVRTDNLVALIAMTPEFHTK